jgi:hypothetical protein
MIKTSICANRCYFFAGAGFAGMERFHLLPEQRDEVLTVARQDGVATEGDIGLELR